jgi:hypothetical protein
VSVLRVLRVLRVAYSSPYSTRYLLPVVLRVLPTWSTKSLRWFFCTQKYLLLLPGCVECQVTSSTFTLFVVTGNQYCCILNSQGRNHEVYNFLANCGGKFLGSMSAAPSTYSTLPWPKVHTVVLYSIVMYLDPLMLGNIFLRQKLRPWDNKKIRALDRTEYGSTSSRF